LEVREMTENIVIQNMLCQLASRRTVY
jgi:hypothetical protein